MRGKCPAVAPSSVTFGDSFPPEGEAFRAVYPLGYAAGMAATGGIIAVPTNHPIIFIIIYGRGRGMPRPYRVMFFIAP